MINSPDLVYYSPAARDSLVRHTPTLATDLGIDILVDELIFSELHSIEQSGGHSLEYPFNENKQSRKFTSLILENPTSDLDTILYRQEIFSDLKNERILGTIKEAIDLAVVIPGKLRNLDSSEVGAAGSMIQSMVSHSLFVELLSQELKGAPSEGLGRLRDYCINVRKSRNYTELREFLINLSGNNLKLEFSLDGRLRANEVSLHHSKKIQGTSLGDPGKVATHFHDHMYEIVIDGYLRKFFPQISETRKMFEQLTYYFYGTGFMTELAQNGFETTTPKMLPMKKRAWNVHNASNPLLLPRVKEGYELVANNIDYNPRSNIRIITGMNSGGKTVYIKSVGLLYILAQGGFDIPARNGSSISVVDGLYTHFVSKDDIGMGEGTHDSSLKRLREIVENATYYSMLLLDEPTRGTSDKDGVRESLDFLYGANRLGSATYMTTHLHDLCRSAERRFKSVNNLQTEIIRGKRRKLEPTYRIIEGAAGQSYGTVAAGNAGITKHSIRKSIDGRVDRGELKKRMLR
ncbi:MAG TPA: hypothetical protein VI564_02500 [Candidatus Nanoarchaeia archaeon]|nr:hypothetical protein [Candidatus Nanoarchaeia archaeon]